MPAAVGGVLAAAAAAAGNEVALRVRTPIAELRVLHDDVETVVPADISTEPAGPVADVVFLVVKATDTASAAAHLAAVCGPDTLTVAVQNGIDHAARVTPHLPAGAGPVCPTLIYVAAERLGPGRIHHIHGGRLVVPSEHAETISAAVGTTLRVRATDDIVTESWRKLLANLLGNPITAITQRHMDVMRSPSIVGLSRSVLVEAAAVGRAEGAELTDEDVESVLEGVTRFGEETGSSMLYDREAGRPMEHQYLTGEIVRRGALHGIPVPVNATLLALLEAIDESRSPH